MATKRDHAEDWLHRKWRPMMAMMYMVVCMFDFLVAPILWSLLQAMQHGQITNQWNPLTLQGAGLFHLAMGGVLGIAAYGRTQEKLSGSSVVPLPTPAPVTSTPVSPVVKAAPISFPDPVQ